MENKFKQWDKEVKEGMWEREYKGVLDSILAFTNAVNFIKSDEAKELFTETEGEMQYLEMVRLSEKKLNERKVELAFIKKTLLKEK